MGSSGKLREVALPIAVFVALVLAMTAVSFFASPPSSRTGTLRPPGSIPTKVAELAAVGVALGLVASVPLRRLDLPLLVLSVGFVLLPDVDHLPSVFDVAEPIRPAHSFVFLAILLVLLAAVAPGRPHLELAAAASFIGHIAIGAGVFPLLAPLSYQYYGVDGLAGPLLAVAAALAFSAGLARRRLAA